MGDQFLIKHYYVNTRWNLLLKVWKLKFLFLLRYFKMYISFSILDLHVRKPLRLSALCEKNTFRNELKIGYLPACR